MQTTIQNTNCYRTLRSERHSSASAREPKVYRRFNSGIFSILAILLILSVETIFCPVGFAQPSYTQSTISLPTTGTTYSYGVDYSGNVYLLYSDGYTNEILKGPGIWTPIITGLSSRYVMFAIDPSGDIFIADGAKIYEETPSPSGSSYVQTVFYDFSLYGTYGVYGLAVDPSGNLYVNAQAFQNVGQNRNYAGVLKMVPTPGGAPVVTVVTGLIPNWFPSYVEADGNGNLFVCDGTNVDEWSPSGSGYVKSTLFTATLNSYGGLTEPVSLGADAAGNLFITISEGGNPPAPIQEWVEEVASPSGYTQVPLDLPGLAGTFAYISNDISDNLYTGTVDSSGNMVSLLEEVANPPGQPFAPTMAQSCPPPPFAQAVSSSSSSPQHGRPPSAWWGLAVTLADATPGATIYYTTDGTTPTTSSTQYTGAFYPAVPVTVKAIASAGGSENSPVASTTYTELLLCRN